jgi:hypothetical protein
MVCKTDDCIEMGTAYAIVIAEEIYFDELSMPSLRLWKAKSKIGEGLHTLRFSS